MISVFGGTGFIGSTFCSKFENITYIVPKTCFTPIYGSKVLYLISTVDNYNVLTDNLIDINTNLIHLMKVLENCKNQDIEFIFISSWFVYGDTDFPANENSICKPKGFYSITKYTAELLIESFCKTFNIRYKIIRLGNVLGTSDSKVSKKKNALQFLLEEMKHNRDIKLYNDGDFYRDFIHVDDVVDGIKFIMDNGENQNIYNLSGGKPILFKDIINYAYLKLNCSSQIGIMIPTDFHKIVQVESMYLDNSKLNKLGFTPNKNIYTTIDELL